MIAGGVDVWTASLDWDAPQLEEFHAILDDEERHRAARFRSAIDRARFTAKHAIRRLVLAGYLDRPAREIEFTGAVDEKPQLREGRRLRFSDSASGALAVYALADVDVGIDVERIRSISDAPGIVERFGSRRERSAFRRLAPAGRELAFLRWWTAKEAFVKALGTGLQRGLDGFSVSFPSSTNLPPSCGDGWEGGPRLLDVNGNLKARAGFSLAELIPGDGYVGALVAVAGPMSIRLRAWTSSRALVGGAV